MLIHRSHNAQTPNPRNVEVIARPTLPIEGVARRLLAQGGAHLNCANSFEIGPFQDYATWILIELSAPRVYDPAEIAVHILHLVTHRGEAVRKYANSHSLKQKC